MTHANAYGMFVPRKVSLIYRKYTGYTGIRPSHAFSFLIQLNVPKPGLLKPKIKSNIECKSLN